MRKFFSVFLSMLLVFNLVGCINVTITPESNTTNEVKTEEKVQQEVPQKQEETKKEEKQAKQEEPAKKEETKKEEAKKEEAKKEEQPKQEEKAKEEQQKEEAKEEQPAKEEKAKEDDNTSVVECDWITKQDFVETMTEMLNEQGIPFEYMELVEQNNDPMFIVTDNVGICGYVDEANNVTQIAVIGLGGSSYEEYQYAGQLFGIALAVFTEDAGVVNEVTSIFDQKDGIYNTENFIYEYHESDTGEVIITITPSHLANSSYKYHIDENGDKYVTKDEVI